MKIALIGYGKMGKAIETLAAEAGHTIVLKYRESPTDPDELAKCDVAIEFSVPEKAVFNIKQCFVAHIPVVVGTTGWYSEFDQIKKLAESTGQSLFFATNFSLGVNLFFELNKKLARLMNSQPDYEPKMQEIHHIQKKDAPSGTAITLAEGLLQNFDRKNEWICREEGKFQDQSPFMLEIEALRINEVPGTHTITYQSAVDEISITHQAYSRTGFASGALKAAEWIVGKKGVYTMKDMLGLDR
ncbi:MAG: 4-hydroxy-tetrahydrodipicolinate reductase [Flavobacteriales bacterium]|nr:4-hydroxy-tetrahydrodipicolinate reductase [Flavobacteriales bacterium]